MKTKTLLDKIGDIWPDASFHQIVAGGGTHNGGDMLALYLYHETVEMTDYDASTQEQLDNMFWLLDRAVKELENVRLKLQIALDTGELE